MTDAVVVQNLGKCFKRYHLDRPWTLHEALLRGFGKLAPSDCFWGVQDVSFRVSPGQMIGVIGRNGAGKSTLLRLIGGVGKPDRGSVKVHGRLGALLNLGAGFHPDLTGRENLFIAGLIGGLTRSEIASRLDDIVEFSELEQYMDSPLRAYSTGMQMRLAFSISVHSLPDVLLIDEVLAVGDAAFQRKCVDRILRMKSDGCAIILVSHETAMIQEFCDEVLWLENGRVAAHGAAAAVVARYLAETVPSRLSHHEEVPPESRGQSANITLLPACVRITRVNLVNPLGSAGEEISAFNPLIVEISYAAARRVDTLNFRVHVYRDDGVRCCDFTTETSGSSLSSVEGEGMIALHVDHLGLNGGLYHIDVGAFADDPEQGYDYREKIVSLVIRQEAAGKDVLTSPHRWQAKCLSAAIAEHR